jgi:hypothetical protein
MKPTGTISLIIMIVFLAACGGGGGAEDNGGSTSFNGEVDIVFPSNGTVIYAEAITVSGTMFGADQQTFTVELIDPDDAVIASADVQTQEGDWSVEIPHNYTGDPSEVTVRAVPSGEVEGEYDSATILLSNASLRPEGTFGTITAPLEGDVVGGDSILIEGTASGLFENTLIVEMVLPEGTVLAEQILTVNNPYFIDEVPWQAELAFSDDYTGPASIRAYYTSADEGSEIDLDQVGVMVEVAAG